MDKIKAYSYLRFSTDRQRKGSSFARQKAAINRWLKINPQYELQEKRFEGEGESGYKAHHLKKGGSLKLLLDAIESGEITKGSAIIVEQFNRLSRESIDKQEETLFKIWKHGVTFITVSDNGVYPPNAIKDDIKRIKIISGMKISHRESEIKAMLSKGSYEDRFEITARILEKKSKNIELDEDEKEFKLKLPSMPFWLDKLGKLNGKEVVIKKIFKLYSEGYGQLKIRQKIKDKFPNLPEAQRMNQTSVLRWIKSRKVLGEWEYQDKSVKAFDAAISEEVFFTVQAIYIQKKKTRVNPDRHWEIRGLCKCGYCGATMSVQNIPHSLPYLRCTKRQRMGKDTCKSSPSFPYIIAKYFFKNFVKNDLERALSTQIENKSDQVKLNKLKYELSQLEISLEDLKKEYIESKSRSILSIISDTDDQIDDTNNKIKEMEGSLMFRSYLSDEIRKLDDEPQRQNRLFNNLDLKIFIKDKKIEFKTKDDHYWLEYDGYVKSEKKFHFKTNQPDLSIITESNKKLKNIKSESEAFKIIEKQNKKWKISETKGFITRSEAENYAK
jgi:hypothetical protein